MIFRFYRKILLLTNLYVLLKFLITNASDTFGGYIGRLNHVMEAYYLPSSFAIYANRAILE